MSNKPMRSLSLITTGLFFIAAGCEFVEESETNRGKSSATQIFDSTDLGGPVLVTEDCIPTGIVTVTASWEMSDCINRSVFSLSKGSLAGENSQTVCSNKSVKVFREGQVTISS
jgi:hypothetical protein